MPFGEKHDPSGGPLINFDRVYEEGLAPAIRDAGMEPIRADEERTGGIIHKPMFERLLLCDYAVADLTTANANVFYELGVRHTARPRTTLTIYADHRPIPFDVNFLRSTPYQLGDDNRFGVIEADALRATVTDRLHDLRESATEPDSVDSPLFQLLGEWVPGDVARLKTDLFRDAVRLNEDIKRRLATVRATARDSSRIAEATAQMAEVRSSIEPIVDAEAGTLVDLLLTHRALEDWNGMIALYADLPAVLRRQVLLREQVAFAYNRRAGANDDDADRDKALAILEDVEEQQGPSSETGGLIGRIYKDRWKAASAADDHVLSAAYLGEAIDAYRRGFHADQRDTYPGVNLVALLDIRASEHDLEEKSRVLPVVRFSTERRLLGGDNDYWDHASALELDILDDDGRAATASHRRAVALIRERWEPRSTAANLRLILDARRERGEEQPWLERIVTDLEQRAH
jgi:hypothetical protein